MQLSDDQNAYKERVGAAAVEAIAKHMIMVLGDKGGSGKSLFARLMCYFLRSEDLAAFDADGTTGSLARINGVYDAQRRLVMPQPPGGVTPLQIHGTAKDVDALPALLEASATTTLVDMPATSLSVLEAVERDWRFGIEIENSGFTHTCVVPVTPFQASLKNLQRTVDLYPGARLVVVLNLGFGDISDFVLYYGDGQLSVPESRARALVRSLGDRGAEVLLPALRPPRILALIDALRLPFDQAIEDRRLTLPDRRRLERWLGEVRAAVRPAAQLLNLTRVLE